MSCQSNTRFTRTIALPLCMLLSGCGGGGAQVASIPPPPATATPTATAKLDVKVTPLDLQGTKAGTYDLLGRLTSTLSSGTKSSVLTAGEASLTIAKQNDVLNFTVKAPGLVPNGAVAFPSPEIFWSPDLTYGNQLFEDDHSGKWPQFLGQRLTAYRIQSDGSEEESELYDFKRGTSLNGESTFTYDIGYSYVAMGEWASSSVQPGAFPAAELLLVHGDRTPPAGIPVSGTATYDAHTLSLLSACYDSACPGIYFAMTADFGLRTISTRIDQNYQYYTDLMGYGEPAIRNGPILGIHVNGTAAFNNDGSFDIPLTGTANYSATNALTTPPSEPVTGTMDGAFFGPNAENVGGTFGLNRADRSLMVQDAFIGQQRH
jgi:hypothetical protein